MKLSIIICTYNAGECLGNALNSLLTQTYKDFEVVIMDSASVDETLDIIKDYENKFDGGLRWVSEKDDGIYDAMNKGVDLATGDWVYFLGADDILFDDGVLDKISENMTKENDVLYGNVEWGGGGKIYDGKFSALKIMEENICHQAIFFRKQVFEKIGKFEVKYKAWADWAFNLKWFCNEDIKNKYVNLVIARYNTDGFSSEGDDMTFVREFDFLIEKHFPREYLDNRNKIKNLEQQICNKDQEINSIKSLKFWKIREKYLKLRSFLNNRI